MAEHAGKPKVRFAGFTEAWEQRKLGELLAESKIKGHSGNVAKKLTIKLWGKGVVEKKDFGGSVYTQYYIRKYEQFIYSKLDFLNSAFAVIPKNMDGYESTSDLPAFDCVNSNPYFIFYRVTQKDFYLKNGSIADGSRKAKRIHVDTFLGMGINAPKILEQDKIVEFFQVLDRLITLHQRKRGRLENIKKAMLEKMFPKNGADVPEVRFAGFTEAWEQRKLGEIAEKTFGGGTPSTSNPDFWSGKIPWIQSSDLTEDNLFDVKPRKFISKLAIKSSASKIIPKNSIAIIVRVGVGKLAFLPFNYSTSQDFLSITEINVDELFALYSIYKKLKKDLSLVQGTSIKGITKEELLRKTLFIPIKKSEQARIGAFFRHLDRLITLHQRKVALLQNIKKACLEKMFV